MHPIGTHVETHDLARTEPGHGPCAGLRKVRPPAMSGISTSHLRHVSSTGLGMDVAAVCVLASEGVSSSHTAHLDTAKEHVQGLQRFLSCRTTRSPRRSTVSGDVKFPGLPVTSAVLIANVYICWGGSEYVALLLIYILVDMAHTSYICTYFWRHDRPCGLEGVMNLATLRGVMCSKHHTCGSRACTKTMCNSYQSVHEGHLFAAINTTDEFSVSPGSQHDGQCHMKLQPRSTYMSPESRLKT